MSIDSDIAWDYDDCNGMSDTYEAAYNGVQLCVVGYADSTWWCADKNGTRVEGIAEDDSAGQRCAIAATNALLTLFAALSSLQGGRVTDVRSDDQE